MPKRTIAEARRALEEDLAPTLNDYWLRTHRATLASAEAKARQEAEKILAPREQEVRAICDEGSGLRRRRGSQFGLYRRLAISRAACGARKSNFALAGDLLLPRI